MLQSYWEESLALANGLMRLGYTKGSRIGIWMPNNYDWVRMQLACSLAGTARMVFAFADLRASASVCAPTYRCASPTGIISFFPTSKCSWGTQFCPPSNFC